MKWRKVLCRNKTKVYDASAILLPGGGIVEEFADVPKSRPREHRSRHVLYWTANL